MDLFLAGCQGVGLALAAGAFGGAAARRDAIGTILLVAAIVVGAALFGLSLAAGDHPAWPGWPLGAVLAALSFVVVRDFAEGAARRADGGGLTSAAIALAALALGGLSLLLPPAGLAALAALIWLAAARRQRAARKYEGLRTLR